MKKKEDIADYCTAGEAAQILTDKLGRPIITNYIRKMSKSRKHSIRTAQINSIILYHRVDVTNCTITQKSPMKQESA
jgi:hypothetical protein